MRRRAATSPAGGCPDRTAELTRAFDWLVDPRCDDLAAAAGRFCAIVQEAQRRCPDGRCGTCGATVMLSYRLRLSVPEDFSTAVSRALNRAQWVRR